MLRRVAPLAIVTAGVLLLTASAANAATIEVVDGAAVLTAALGERNDVRMQPTPFTVASAVTVSDAGAPLIAGPGCEQLATGSARCPEPAWGSLRLVVSTEDGSDRVSLDELCCRQLTVRGGRGNDALAVSSHNGAPAELDGGPGDDVLFTNEQLGGAPLLRGGTGNDSLRICCGSTVGGLAYGGDGDDRLDWSNGTRSESVPLVLDGGRGDDTYSFGQLFVPGAMVPGSGFDTLDQSAVSSLAFDWRSCSRCVERAIGTPNADSITGDGNAQVILGGDGDDVLDGGGGPDVISGQDGADTIMARDAAIDAVSCGGGSDGVTADRFDLVKRDCEQVGRAARPM